MEIRKIIKNGKLVKITNESVNKDYVSHKTRE